MIATAYTKERRPLKVCLASWAPFLAGAEVAAERLALGLVEAGHDVLVVLGTEGEALDRVRGLGLRCEYVPMHMTDKWRWWRHAAAQRKFAQLLAQERPDVVHFNDLPTSQMVGRSPGKMGIPRVCHHRFPFDEKAIDWLNKYGAERHLFVSRAVMDELCENSAKLCASPCSVVYDGLPLPAMPADEDRLDARRALDLPRDKRLALFVGQIIERKGVADLVRAWMLLPEAVREDSELLIVGDDLQNQGAYRKAMERLAAELGCPARFFGFQKNVPQWLTAADVALVPSHVEPLGNATLEAMAHGLPVIGGDVGGIPEMIVHEQTGLLVPAKQPQRLAEAMARLLGDGETRRQYGAAARRRCEEKFSLEAHTKSVLAEYEAVLAQVKEESRRIA